MTDFKSGASILNSIKDTSTSFTGYWEDVKDYNAIVLTLQSPMDGSGTLQWANTARRQQPPTDNDIIAEESFLYTSATVKTLQWPHRGRWFKLVYTDGATGAATYADYSLNIETLNKAMATEQKFGDDAQNTVHLHQGDGGIQGYQIAYTDNSGTPLGITGNADPGEALYVHLRDVSNTYSYAYTAAGSESESLYVALRDNNRDNLDLTASGSALYVHPSNEAGYSQAGTVTISGSYTGDGALFIALADNSGEKISTTSNTSGNVGNALYVHLTLKDGTAVSTDNPIPCEEVLKIGQLSRFDISSGIRSTAFSSTSDLQTGLINLHSFFTYNDGPTTVWTKLYDMSQDMVDSLGVSDFAQYKDRILLNVATPAGRYRDFKFPRGMLFAEGLHFRSSTEHTYDASADPGEDVVFINGCYYKNRSTDQNYLEDIDINYGARSLFEPEPEPGSEFDGGFQSLDVPEFGLFSMPFALFPDEPEPEPMSTMTGLEDLQIDPEPEPEPEPEPQAQDKTIAFRADGDNYIEGTVTFSYIVDDELLSLSTLVSSSVRSLKDIAFCYDDDMGNQIQYDIDITGLVYGTPLSTESINITQEQLQTSKVLITLDNDMEVNIAYNGV